MTLYKVRATVIYVVDLPNEDAVYDHADETDFIDVEQVSEVRVIYVREDKR